MGDIRSDDEFEEKLYKVVCDLDNNALFFSREPIPTRMFGNVRMRKQSLYNSFHQRFLT